MKKQADKNSAVQNIANTGIMAVNNGIKAGSDIANNGIKAANDITKIAIEALWGNESESSGEIVESNRGRSPIRARARSPPPCRRRDHSPSVSVSSVARSGSAVDRHRHRRVGRSVRDAYSRFDSDRKVVFTCHSKKRCFRRCFWRSQVIKAVRNGHAIQNTSKNPDSFKVVYKGIVVIIVKYHRVNKKINKIKTVFRDKGTCSKFAEERSKPRKGNDLRVWNEGKEIFELEGDTDCEDDCEDEYESDHDDDESDDDDETVDEYESSDIDRALSSPR
ncbi:MAG: hypothetical protein SGARI_000646, partial [Bacillariaceae sp.]